MTGITIPNQGLSTTLSYGEFNQLLEALKDGTRDVTTYGLTVNGTLAATSPVFTTPNLGTPATIVGTNITGSATALTSGYATNIVGGSGGGIVYQTATSASAVLTNGIAGQVLISQGTTLAPTWSTPSSDWNFIETLTPSGATMATSSILPTYARYRLDFILNLSGTVDSIGLKLNNVVSSTYATRYLNNVTVTSANTIYYYVVPSTSGSTDKHMGTIYVQGLSDPLGYCEIAQTSGITGSNYLVWGGNCSGMGASTQVTRLTFIGGGSKNLTGTIHIYGKN